ncbi:hypothetical protein [Actinocrispum wychmicini]|uniref:Concanavalin A-like lectin/glucanase superfamily protein n=1 Tax=Actinocrispum wychmicini TaxID=1213861 RepID=A0A4R2IYA0_9PSEU|nr:hypothetical protein [Actinocrispum wychmicini]TCO50823.1 hypothetical protein EV192_113204 [Actinocrispum wychmicini]
MKAAFLRILVAVFVLFVAVLTPNANATTVVFSENFQTTPTGPLGAPWSISQAGASTAVVMDTSDHGRVLELRGSTTLGDFLIASRSLSSSATEILESYAIKPSAGSAFVTAFNGAGSSIGARRVRLQRAPGSNTLVAQTSPSGSTDCTNLTSGVWSTVTLKVHATTLPHTFDVLVNGAATSCTGITTGLSAPFNGLNVMDASNDGWGGKVQFDDFLVTTP